jgi:hypothetical protein
MKPDVLPQGHNGAHRRLVSFDALARVSCSAESASSTLGAASWRMPRVPGVLDVRGAGPRARRGQFLRRLTLGRQRRILRMLADGATVRQVSAATRSNFTVIAALRRAALRWEDPDDE